MPTRSRTLFGASGARPPRYASVRLVTMNNAASVAVVRDRNDAEPRAPNTVPEAPAPKPAPASAPLPLCSSTSATMAAAISRWNTTTAECNQFISIRFRVSNLVSLRGGADLQKFIGLQRCPADQSAIDVGHGEDL